MTPAEFIALVLPAARSVRERTGLPVSFLIGQWAHETAWGGSPAATVDSNYAGIKPWAGRPAAGVTGYAHYADLVDWADGYSRFVLENDLYAPAVAAARSGADPCDVASLMSPWVGQPGQVDQLTGQVIQTGYGQAICSIIQLDGLKVYDGAVSLDPKAVEDAIRAPDGYAAHLEDLELGPMKKTIDELTARVSDLETSGAGADPRAFLRRFAQALLSLVDVKGPPA